MRRCLSKHSGMSGETADQWDGGKVGKSGWDQKVTAFVEGTAYLPISG